MAYEYYRAAKKKGLKNKYDRWRIMAKELELSREAKNRLEWMIFYETKAEKDTSLTARYFGIGRSTFHKWRSRFDEANLRSLETRSRAPKKVRQRQFIPVKDQRVIGLRKQYPYFGKMNGSIEL